jgi:hypothetical protein
MTIKYNKDNACPIPIMRYGNITSNNIFDNISNKDKILDLIKTTEGKQFLAQIRNYRGSTVLHIISHKYEDIALQLINNENDMKLLFDTKDNCGRCAMYKSVYHENVSLELIKSQKNLELLANTVDYHGTSILHEMVCHKKVASKLMETIEGMNLMANTKDNYGWSVLHEIAFRHTELFKTEESKKMKLLSETKDNKGWSVLQEIMKYNKISSIRKLKREYLIN